MAVDSKVITKAIRNHFLHHSIMVPNFYIDSCECDVFSITPTDYTHEFEIKISLQDLKADFKKEIYLYKQNRRGNKHVELLAGNRTNYFSFVVTTDLMDGTILKDVELHPSIGLYVYDEIRGFLREVQKPKLLHRNKYDSYRRLAIKLGARLSTNYNN